MPNFLESGEEPTDTNVINLAGVELRLYQRRLEQCMEQFVDRDVLELALECSANGGPPGIRYNHIVRVLLKDL